MVDVTPLPKKPQTKAQRGMYGRTCTIEGCDKPHFSRGWCKAHHARWRRNGDPLGGRASNLRGIPVFERFFLRRTITVEGCWVITGSDATGYTKIRTDEGREMRTHRWAYEHFVGPIPEDLVIDHLCRNRACANPSHLEAVTQQVNTHRGIGPTAINAAKTHCNRGHDLSDAYIVPSTGSRLCMVCQRERMA